MYQRKTKDVWRLMSNYGYGWECEVEYEDRAEAKRDLRAYRENCPNAEYKLEKHRERIAV